MSKKTEELKKEKNKKKRIIWIICGVLFVAFVIWVIILNTGVETYKVDGVKYTETKEKTNLVAINVIVTTSSDIKEKGTMIAELYSDSAPITVENFKKLVSQKYYDGLLFHRVIDDFMIQTGDPTGTGSGGSEETIKGEFKNNGVNNTLSHTRGVLSMARRVGNPDTKEYMDSASSQFFIVQNNATHLDGVHAAFGKVIGGLEWIDKIASVEVDENDKPVVNQVISNIKFVKKGE